MKKKEIKKKEIKKPIHRVVLEHFDKSLIPELIHERIEYKKITDGEISEIKNYRLILDTCMVEKYNFRDCEFTRSEFIDVVFKDCELTNNIFKDCIFIRVEFINCKLVGTQYVTTQLSDLLFDEVYADYLDVSECKFKNVKFTDSSLKSATIFHNKVNNLLLESVNLMDSTFHETSLNGVDLSSSEISGIRIEPKNIEGAIIATWQAVDLCRLLGVYLK